MIDELSIIIPTLNEEIYLPRLLRSIVDQNYRGKLEVIIVDGESTDDTIKLAKKFNGKIKDLSLLTTKRDIGHQRNVGARKAKYRYLLFLDADVILANECLNTLYSKAVVSLFVATAFHSSDNLYFTDYFFLGIVYILFFIAYLGRSPVINGDFILTSKRNHENINGFKEDAILGEDTDYGLRSIKNGARYYFFFQILVYGSDRSMRKIGRTKLFLIWSKAFLHVRKYGPIYKTAMTNTLYNEYIKYRCHPRVT